MLQSSNIGNTSAQDRILVVTDVKSQSFILIAGIVAVIASFMGLFIIGIPIAIMCFYRYKVLKDGIVLNLDTGRLQFPGGQIAANQITDYLSKDFLLQMFKRFDIAVSDIQLINKKVNVSLDDKGKPSYRYTLQLSGKFGSAAVTFIDEGKCDQCFAMITQVNNMGIPVVNR